MAGPLHLQCRAHATFPRAGRAFRATLARMSKDKVAEGLRELVDRSVKVRVYDLAVTKQQIEQWNLPSRPTKTSDTRSRKFVAEHGDRPTWSWDGMRLMVEEASPAKQDQRFLRVSVLRIGKPLASYRLDSLKADTSTGR